jgi:hypothetical protein
LKDLNKFPTTQFVYNQIWQSSFKKYKVHLVILGKTRTCNFFLNGHILCNELKKTHFWIHIEFIKKLGQFKQKYIVDLFMLF